MRDNSPNRASGGSLLSSSGLTLIGFLDEPLAKQYLSTACMPQGRPDADLGQIWRDAKSKIGSPTPNAGNPDIQPIPMSHAAYIQTLAQQPWIAPNLAIYPGHTFGMVEIAPLLAFQFSVDVERSQHHCARFGNSPPSLQAMLDTCLPMAQPAERHDEVKLEQSALIKTRCLNVQMGARGIFQGFMGFGIQLSLPVSHVVRFNGRCYLHNGYHRAYGLLKAGATHMPCLIRDVPDARSAGLIGGIHTFEVPLLESANPPTLAHFDNGQALDVALRAASRILHVSWADYIVYDE